MDRNNTSVSQQAPRWPGVAEFTQISGGILYTGSSTSIISKVTTLYSSFLLTSFPLASNTPQAAFHKLLHFYLYSASRDTSCLNHTLVSKPRWPVHATLPAA
ncbi:hypothetical protein RRG08_008048 [Elysia crispata]|uniref:Uncharacterized protein n=1 Tax=Elysia crispata TaxID=231223 RepID=A0AAE1AHF8_9GAST|nr:hypothetical protein RRG08_008048 [Elysia crispata]